MPKLHGVIPPLPTPFDQHGNLDLTALETLITALEPHVDGFLVLGSTGEAAFLSEEERQDVFRAARAAIPSDKPMLVGTGAESTAQTLTRQQSAYEVGADVALVLPPHYYASAMTEKVLKTHYQTVADESPVPVMLYNFPAVTTLALSPALIADLAEHPNIVGVKDSSGNVVALTETLGRVPEDFSVMTGNASTFLPALALGAKGGILAVADVAAPTCQKLFEAFEAGDWREARALQLSLQPLAQAVTTRYGIPGLKAAINLQGLNAGYPRAPLLELKDEQALEALSRLLSDNSQLQAR